MKSVGFVCGDLYMSVEARLLAVRLIPAEKTLFFPVHPGSLVSGELFQQLCCGSESAKKNSC